MKLNSQLFNRFKKPADGWIHIAPYGQHPHEQGVQVVNEAVVQGLVAKFNAAGKRPILIDYDHNSHDPSKSTEAGGWLEELEARNDGLWGRVRWSAQGEQKITNGDYRYNSPVWLAEKVDGADGPLLFPTELKDIGLTNQPNIKGQLPLSNRTTSVDEQKDMKEIAKKLGLDSTASETEIVQAINRLQTDSAANKTRADQLEIEVANSRKEEAKRIAQERGVEGDAATTFINTFVQNREVAMNIINLLPKPKVDGAQPATQPLTNRSQAATPSNPPFGGATEEERQAQEARAAKVFNRAMEIANTQKIPWAQAFEQASNVVV